MASDHGESLLSDSVGPLLLRARKQLKISRESLAKRAGVSVRLLADLERGRRPNVSLETTLRLLTLSGISVIARAPDADAIELARPDRESVRAARAALRMRTWTGGHLPLHAEQESPSAGETPTARFAAMTQISEQAAAWSARGHRYRRRSR